MKRFMRIRMFIYVVSFILVAFVAIGKIKTSCFFYDNYGFLCPACGLTRATISIVKLKLVEAVQYNLYYVCILVPLLLILVANDIYTFFRREVFKKKCISFIEIIFGESKV